VLIIDQPYWQETIDGVLPDVSMLPENIAYAHRKTEDQDIYFLSNQRDGACAFTVSFPIENCSVRLYDPVTDETYPLSYRTVHGTTVDLKMLPHQSLFVIFDKTAGERQGDDSVPVKREQQVVPMKSLWDMDFKENHLMLKKQPLFDWSKHPDERIRYFSGHVRYTTHYRQKAKPAGRVWMSFPQVKDIAHVWINGVDCGIAWTAPYQVEITKALKKGNNVIEIEVVNTWHNALRGADQGKAPYDGIWTNAKYRTKGDELLPAGLLEPPLLIIRN